LNPPTPGLVSGLENGESPDCATLPRVVLGAVLCGGGSRRMGQDKALLSLAGKSLLARAAEVLAALGAPVVLACGAEDRYAQLGLERVLDRGADLGPLAGLEAALDRACHAGNGYICVLACDMPRASARVFEQLLLRAEARGADACLLATPAGLEPLLAVYSTRCLDSVRRALDAGERRMDAFHRRFGALVIETLDTQDLPEETPAEVARNLNTPAEFQVEGGLKR